MNDGLEVEGYLRTCGLGKGHAWCAAFVNWVHMKAGVETGIKSPAWSPSWFADASRITYKRSWNKEIEPKPGQVFGLYFSSLKRVAHVGFIDSFDKKNLYTVEGNTNAAGSREGDGVYRKIRPKSTIYIIADYINEYENGTKDWRK